MNAIGYARTTINDSDLDVQLSLLTTYGCDKIYQETYKLTETENGCSLLDSIIDDLKENDTLVICRLSHLGKSTRQLTEFAEILEEHNVHLVSLEEKIDTRGPEGAAYFKVMRGLAKMECELIKERTLVGLTKARKKGIIGGRPKTDMKIVHKIRQMYFQKHENVQVIASKCQVSIGTCYKYINLTEKDIQQLGE